MYSIFLSIFIRFLSLDGYMEMLCKCALSLHPIAFFQNSIALDNAHMHTHEIQKKKRNKNFHFYCLLSISSTIFVVGFRFDVNFFVSNSTGNRVRRADAERADNTFKLSVYFCISCATHCLTRSTLQNFKQTHIYSIIKWNGICLFLFNSFVSFVRFSFDSIAGSVRLYATVAVATVYGNRTLFVVCRRRMHEQQ